MEFKKTKGK
jgi:hypothetical protein